MPEGAPLRAKGESAVLRPEDFGDEMADLLAQLGPGASMLVTPIFDADLVTGCVAVVAPDLDQLTVSDRTAVQLCGELVWRHMRHHDARAELHRCAEVAETLAHVSGRLHEGGIGDARELLDGVIETVAAQVDAVAIRMFEAQDSSLSFLLEWAEDGHCVDEQEPTLSTGARKRLASGELVLFDELTDGTDVDNLTAGFFSGAIVPGLIDDELVGVFVVGRTDNRPLSDKSLELITGAVGLLGQFRVRMGAELDLVRRGVVEQARTEIAESFLNSSAREIDATALATLERVGSIFDARRVRWVELVETGKRPELVLEWDDGSRPEPPTEFAVGAGETRLERREPFVLTPADVLDHCGVASPSPTLVVPIIADDEVLAVLSLTGDSLARPLPTDELCTLTDLAGVILQARRRAAQEIERECRQVLDDVQLRLAARFIDRGVTNAAEILDWVLGELGAVLDTDLIAFAEYIGTSDGIMHWWTRSEQAEATADAMNMRGGEFHSHFAKILERGKPRVTRSRMMPEAE